MATRLLHVEPLLALAMSKSGEEGGNSRKRVERALSR
jgi:hypothetical protein